MQNSVLIKVQSSEKKLDKHDRGLFSLRGNDKTTKKNTSVLTQSLQIMTQKQVVLFSSKRVQQKSVLYKVMTHTYLFRGLYIQNRKFG
jgi:hypothetical protein